KTIAENITRQTDARTTVSASGFGAVMRHTTYAPTRGENSISALLCCLRLGLYVAIGNESAHQALRVRSPAQIPQTPAASALLAHGQRIEVRAIGSSIRFRGALCGLCAS